MPGPHINADEKDIKTLAIGLAPREYYPDNDDVFMDTIPVVPSERTEQVVKTFLTLLDDEQASAKDHFYAAMGLGLLLIARDRILAPRPAFILSIDFPAQSAFAYFRKALLCATEFAVEADVALVISKMSESMNSPNYDFMPLINFYIRTQNASELYELINKLEIRHRETKRRPCLTEEKVAASTQLIDLQNIIISGLRDMANKNNLAAQALLASHYFVLYKRSLKQNDGFEALEFAEGLLDSPYKLDIENILKHLSNSSDKDIKRRAQILLGKQADKVNDITNTINRYRAYGNNRAAILSSYDWFMQYSLQEDFNPYKRLGTSKLRKDIVDRINLFIKYADSYPLLVDMLLYRISRQLLNACYSKKLSTEYFSHMNTRLFKRLIKNYGGSRFCWGTDCELHQKFDEAIQNFQKATRECSDNAAIKNSLDQEISDETNVFNNNSWFCYHFAYLLLNKKSSKSTVAELNTAREKAIVYLERTLDQEITGYESDEPLLLQVVDTALHELIIQLEQYRSLRALVAINNFFNRLYADDPDNTRFPDDKRAIYTLLKRDNRDVSATFDDSKKPDDPTRDYSQKVRAVLKSSWVTALASTEASQRPETTVAFYQNLIAEGNLEAIDQLAAWYKQNVEMADATTTKDEKSAKETRTLFEIYFPIIKQYNDVPIRLKILGHLLQSKNRSKKQREAMFKLLKITFESAFASLESYSTHLYEIYLINPEAFTREQLKILFKYYIEHPSKKNLSQLLNIASDERTPKTGDGYNVKKIYWKSIEQFATVQELSNETVNALMDLYYQYHRFLSETLFQNLMKHILKNPTLKNVMFLFKCAIYSSVYQTDALQVLLQEFPPIAQLPPKQEYTLADAFLFLGSLLHHKNKDFQQAALVTLKFFANSDPMEFYGSHRIANEVLANDERFFKPQASQTNYDAEQAELKSAEPLHLKRKPVKIEMRAMTRLPHGFRPGYAVRNSSSSHHGHPSALIEVSKSRTP